MSKKEYIDFKKEFEEFKKELENSKPIFDDEEIVFDKLDNLIEDDFAWDDTFENSNLNEDFPQISLETDILSLSLILKKDYSNINDLDIRKKEFIDDLNNFIEEFVSTEEFNQLMKYYD